MTFNNKVNPGPFTSVVPQILKVFTAFGLNGAGKQKEKDVEYTTVKAMGGSDMSYSGFTLFMRCCCVFLFFCVGSNHAKAKGMFG